MTENEFNQLIYMPKVVIEPPKKAPTVQRMSLQNKMKLKSLDEEHLFEVYWRQNTMFCENFSVGLIWLPTDGSYPVTLMRCNGPHGYDIQDSHHALTHIHTPDFGNIENGKMAPQIQTPTTEYITLEDALRFSLSTWAIHGYEPYFKFLLDTPPLFQ